MKLEIERAICNVAWFCKGYAGAEKDIQAIEAHINELTKALKPAALIDTDEFRDPLNRVRPDTDTKAKQLTLGEVRQARKALGWSEEWPS